MAELVQDIMTKQVRTVVTETPALTAALRMAQNAIRHLPVVDLDGKLVGVLSERDVVKHLSPWLGAASAMYVGGSKPPRIPVSQIMTRSPMSVRPDTTIIAATKLLAAKKIGCLPVVDGSQRVVGIISAVDVLKHVVDEPQVPSASPAD